VEELGELKRAVTLDNCFHTKLNTLWLSFLSGYIVAVATTLKKEKGR
jgi:hypothetical protein